MEMVPLELALSDERAKFMKSIKAGHVKGNSKLAMEKVCVHQRVVDYQYNDKGNPTGNVVCRECGAVVPDPAKVLG